MLSTRWGLNQVPPAINPIRFILYDPARFAGSYFFATFTDMKKHVILFGSIAIAVVVAIVLYFVLARPGDPNIEATTDPEESATANLLYGIDITDYLTEEGTIGEGQTLSTLLAGYGISAARIDQIVKASEGIFDLRNLRADHNYTLFLRNDSTSRLDYFVYEENTTDYVIFSLLDSISIRKEQKDITIQRKKKSGTITSSLWNCMIDAGMPPAMAMELSDIYAWSIDFFGLQKGDHFTVVYDERYVDTVSVGVGRIWGAIFNHAGKDYYAIPFKQGGKITYWDEQGNSLRKNMLKAPLKYSRISSRYSNSRLHPILKIRRPHHGVDYAAPSGTPVHAVADGVVIFKGWGGGGGNTLKIKHNSRLMSGYLHLRSYAKGIVQGKRVNQGDLIGYVGMTGTATGPHLDFRLWMDGKPIDPLKVVAEPVEPITAENRPIFEFVKSRILAELQGELDDSLKITQLDSLVIPKDFHFEAPVQTKADSGKK